MNLRKKQQEYNKRATVYVSKEVVHNFPSHKLSKEEQEALSQFGLSHSFKSYNKFT